MNQKLILTQKILKRNNYILELNDDNVYSITQSQGNSQIVNIYFIFAIALIAFGLLTLYIGSLWGILILGASIPIFNKISKQKNQQKWNFDNLILIKEDKIELKRNNISQVIDTDSIEEINYQVEKSRDVSTGTILAKINEDEFFPILDIFGDDNRYVEDDIKLIAEFLVDIITNEKE